MTPDNGAALPYLLPDSSLQSHDRLLLFHGQNLLPAPRANYWQPRQLLQAGVSGYHCLPLQRSAAGLYAAVAVDSSTAAQLAVTPQPTRALLLDQGFDAFRLIGRGQQLAHWYHSHRFCGACGNLNQIGAGQGLLQCAHCGIDYYPRINPCVIVLVTRARQLLLARHRQRSSHYFSCLAGFIEAGESAEEAVRREVFEEVGLQLGELRYVSSQSWPFPSQLMLGFHAEYQGGEIRLATEELLEAAWFDITQLPAVPAANVSVAGQLIARHCERFQKT